MDSLIGTIILAFIFLFCSAFFSGAETALFSLSRARLLDYANQNKKHRQYIVKLMQRYNRTLTGIVLGNMFMNASLAISINSIISKFSHNPPLALALSLFISLVILLLGGEVTPKAVAILNSEKVADIVAIPLWYYNKFMTPLILLIEKFHSILWNVVGRKSQPPLSHDEYYAFIDLAKNTKAFSDSELKLLHEILDLETLRVSKLVKSRVNISCVYTHMSSNEVAEKIRSSKQKFLPVANKSIDDAELILSSKNFFKLNPNAMKNWVNSSCVFEAVFIPENTSVAKTLSLFERKKIPAALVVDEFGGISGLIEKKDIYASIFGKINEEHEKENWQVKKISHNSWLVNGNLSIEDAQNIIPQLTLPAGEAATIGGLIIEQLGDLPEEGQIVNVGNATISISKIEANKISEFIIIVQQTPEIEEQI